MVKVSISGSRVLVFVNNNNNLYIIGNERGIVLTYFIARTYAFDIKLYHSMFIYGG